MGTPENSVKEGRYRLILIDALNGIGKEGSYWQLNDLLAGVVAYRNGIQQNHLLEDAVLDALDGRAGQYAMGGAAVYFLGTAALYQSSCGIADGTHWDGDGACQ